MKIPKRANDWVAAMRTSPEGSQVVANCQAEEHVPIPVAHDFFHTLSGSFPTGTTPSQAMNKTLASLPQCARCGPKTDLGLALLMRFERLSRLADSDALRKAGVSEQMLIRKPGLADRITELSLGNPSNPRNIVWAALEKQIKSDIASGFSLSQVLDKIGIAEVAVVPWYSIIYSANDLDDDCAVPTVLDAGADHRFRPSKKGAQCGMTKPCTGASAGYPEYVHAKCVVKSPGIEVHTVT